MPLHIDRSSVGREAPLAPLPIETDRTRQPSQATDAVSGDGDQAAISPSGQRLAALRPADRDELDAVSSADDLVRRLLARIQANPQEARGAHQGLDAERAARLIR